MANIGQGFKGILAPLEKDDDPEVALVGVAPQ